MINKRKLSIISIVLVVIFATSCFGPKIFQLKNSNFKLKGRTIAVVSGLSKDVNVMYAHYLTKALQRHTRLRTVSQKTVAAKAKPYPRRIKGPYKSAYLEIKEDYSKTDLKKIKAIQRKLGTKYVLVVWTPTATNTNDSHYQIHTISQFFEFPGAKEVANSKYELTYFKGAVLNLGKGKTPRTPVDAMEQMSEYVAKEIGKKTNTLRKRK